MPLTATPNEHSTKLLRVRDRVKDMVVAKKPLAAGDYMFTAHEKVIGLEVKWSISDLTSSMVVKGEKTGTRLGIEVRKLVGTCDIPILITPPIRDRGDGMLVGDDERARGWQYNSVKGILADVALFGVLVDEWDGDIAQRIAQWYYVVSSKEHEWIKQRGRPEFISLDPVYTEAVWFICSAYGWGPEAAEKALAIFGSVRGVINQDPKTLQKIPGVGPVMATHMHDVVTRDYKPRRK